MRPIGIYIHVPFCLRKCNYCDFASYVCPESQREGYVAQVCQEIETGPGQGSQVGSVFVGGGTPTLLTADQLLCLLEAVRRLSLIHISIMPPPGGYTAWTSRAWGGRAPRRPCLGASPNTPTLWPNGCGA